MPVPFRGERANDLVEHRDGQLGELSGTRAVPPQDLACQRKNHKDALKGRLLVPVLGRQVLRRGPGQQLDVELPRRGPVRVLRAELAFEKAEFDLEAGKAPFLKKIA